MYIVEIIDAGSAELYYNPEIFSTLKEAEDYLKEACEDRHGLEGVIISLLLEKSASDERTMISSVNIVYHT